MINNQDIIINNSNPQQIGIKQIDNQEIKINGGGTVIGITDVLVNEKSVVNNGVAYVEVPTKTSQLQNNSGFISGEVDPTVPSYIKNITQTDINTWNNKQDNLVSGSNIKTINNESILGSGNIEIEGTLYTAGTGISITDNIITNEITSYNNLSDLPTIPTNTSQLINDSNYVISSELSDVAFSGSYADLSNIPEIPTDTSDLINDSGFITKDVNDLTNYTLTSNLSNVATSGNYNDLTNKPSIPTVNNGTLTIQVNGTTVNSFTANSSNNVTTNITVPTATSDLTNDSGYITNKYEEYSNNEIRVGTWINNKPLYRKVIAITTPTVSTDGTYPSNANVNTYISNVDIIYLKQAFIEASGSKYSFPYTTKGGGQLQIFINSSNNLEIITNASVFSNKSGYAILEYTKSTD